MWNSGDGLTRAHWQTPPAGRTLEWLRRRSTASAAATRRAAPASRAPPAWPPCLNEYDDVIRLAAGPSRSSAPVLAGLAAVGRRQGP